MGTKIRDYFIGDFIKNTDDVFEKARALMLYRFSIVFLVIFFLPLTTSVLLGYNKGVFLHIIDTLLMLHFLFLLKKTNNLDKLINYFFILCFLSSMAAAMIYNPEKMDTVSFTWAFSFLTISALMQRGISRIIYVSFFAWLPLLYVYINIQMKGVLTVAFLEQKGAENTPPFLILIPVTLSVYAIWSHTGTIQEAKETMVIQKEIIEEKNKDITDSIIYAKRIQQTLLPTEKYIEKNMERLRKK